MGLLITPEKGPRARIVVVTTTCELIPDGYTPDGSVLDFCTICQKCAASCPSRSIPFGDRQVSNGALRWQIEPESCFEYWATVGTDCGRCMTVCPYSHPDTFYHDLVRWGIHHSGAFRRLAIAGDDLLYGVRPKPKQAPDFTRLQ